MLTDNNQVFNGSAIPAYFQSANLSLFYTKQSGKLCLSFMILLSKQPQALTENLS